MTQIEPGRVHVAQTIVKSVATKVHCELGTGQLPYNLSLLPKPANLPFHLSQTLVFLILTN